MKRFPLFFALVMLPQLAFAQPDAKPQPDANTPLDPRALGQVMSTFSFVFNEDNARAVAMMGAFYNSMQTAKSYQGHFVLTQTTTKDGKTTLSKILDWDSAWQRDEKGYLYKVHSEEVYTVMEEGKTTTEKVNYLVDGLKATTYYATRNVWTEKAQTPQAAYDYSQLAATLPWMTTMLRVPAATNLKTVVQEDGTRKVTSADGNYEAVFGANGQLQSWRSKGRRDGATELTLRFDRLELNNPIPGDLLKWQVPAGAKQVAPSEADVKFNFNLSF